MRPRAHWCERITAGELRALVEPGAERLALGDGLLLDLRWSRCRGCFGAGVGRALLLACPCCGRSARVLWRPPGEGWGCWRCHPISHRSHRRSGARRGHPKPPSWHADRWRAEQLRIVELLGLVEWPPRRLLWGMADLLAAERLPDAPRLNPARDRALLLRLHALESLRVASVIAANAWLLDASGIAMPEGLPRLRSGAERLERATRWAMRRGAHDPRTLRSWNRPLQLESQAAAVCESNGSR